MKIDMNHYIKFTCWTSITAILWGMIAEVIQPSFEVWFGFVFFCVMAILSWAMGVPKK